MSQENVEIVRAVVEAINRRDWDRALKDAAPDFEFDASRAVGPVHGVRGLDQVRQAFEEFHAPWETYRYEVDQFIEAGDHVVTPFTNNFRGREGIEVQARAAYVWTFRDGAIANLCFYRERDEALEAAGLRE